VQSSVSKISRAQICFALTSGIARDGILYVFHITQQLHAIYVYTAYSRLYTVGFARTVGVVWVSRRFEYSHFCRRFGVAVSTCRGFDLLPF